jgi:hypothetical protein
MACNSSCVAFLEALQHRSGGMSEVLPTHGFRRPLADQTPLYRERANDPNAQVTGREDTDDRGYDGTEGRELLTIKDRREFDRNC